MSGEEGFGEEGFGEEGFGEEGFEEEGYGEEEECGCEGEAFCGGEEEEVSYVSEEDA